jgi:cathepsin B
MLKLLCLGLAVAVAMGVRYDDRPYAVRKRMMGARLDGKSHSVEGQDHRHFRLSAEEAAVVKATAPPSFTAGQDKWQQCSSVIGYIKDQAACGSCWAVAASEVIGDRECIACGHGTNVSHNHRGPGENAPGFDISAEQIMSCCSTCGNGCNGGYIIDAMAYYVNTGVVTGGWYNSGCGCQSYEVDPTSHDEGSTPQCATACDDPNYPDSFAADKHFGSEYHAVSGEAAMMTEIMTNGPIECGFTVKQSFEDYFRKNPTGIYTGGGWLDHPLGGHAIKIIGWGNGPNDKGQNVDYWLINNSWNTTWADNGRFKFLRGKNLNGMEAGCAAATPKCANNNGRANSLQCKGIDY